MWSSNDKQGLSHRPGHWIASKFSGWIDTLSGLIWVMLLSAAMAITMPNPAGIWRLVVFVIHRWIHLHSFWLEEVYIVHRQYGEHKVRFYFQFLLFIHLINFKIVSRVRVSISWNANLLQYLRIKCSTQLVQGRWQDFKFLCRQTFLWDQKQKNDNFS